MRKLLLIAMLAIPLIAHSESDDPCDSDGDGIISGAEQYLCQEQRNNEVFERGKAAIKSAEEAALLDANRAQQEREAYQKWESGPGTDCLTIGNMTKCRTRY